VAFVSGGKAQRIPNALRELMKVGGKSTTKADLI
jgi:hypothetical protein